MFLIPHWSWARFRNSIFSSRVKLHKAPSRRACSREKKEKKVLQVHLCPLNMNEHQTWKKLSVMISDNLVCQQMLVNHCAPQQSQLGFERAQIMRNTREKTPKRHVTACSNLPCLLLSSCASNHPQNMVLHKKL